eukprot:TRINITY_DN6428_c1_g1_i1.p1 TRINITY_DN6428_c1_g1~~TRINITY_DN6428_c1_g1_i1.p1  ORF type:complete len:234 (-),score=80.06 TRINITY_DN6428_c1_g1_i1:118-735(-)
MSTNDTQQRDSRPHKTWKRTESSKGFNVLCHNGGGQRINENDGTGGASGPTGPADAAGGTCDAGGTGDTSDGTDYGGNDGSVGSSGGSGSGEPFLGMRKRPSQSLKSQVGKLNENSDDHSRILPLLSSPSPISLFDPCGRNFSSLQARKKLPSGSSPVMSPRSFTSSSQGWKKTLASSTLGDGGSGGGGVDAATTGFGTDTDNDL